MQLTKNDYADCAVDIEDERNRQPGTGKDVNIWFVIMGSFMHKLCFSIVDAILCCGVADPLPSNHTC